MGAKNTSFIFMGAGDIFIKEQNERFYKNIDGITEYK